MFEIITTIFLGILGGSAVGVQSTVVGSMGQRVGGIASSFVVHVSGAVIAGMLLLTRGGEQIRNWRSLSWLMLLSGVFGVILHLTLNRSIPRLGATTAIALIIVGQLIAGMLIDHFGLFGIAQRSVDAGRVAAAVLLIAGGYLMIR